MNAYFIFLAGLAIIIIGSELLLRGASKIASLLGVRPLVIGLTVVSIGTSLPELAVGITAINDGAEDMAIGNIAGTNLVNILLILGLSAAIKPLPLQVRYLKFEMFVMIFTAFLLLVLCMDGILSYWDGLLMLVLGVLYVLLLIRNSRRENIRVIHEYTEEFKPCTQQEKKNVILWLSNTGLLFTGIAATVWGADMLVAGATDIAKALGLSDAVIGLTIIAIGTSAPELVTTLVATYKDDRDVAVGNLLGSSITNILFILSATTLFVPEGLHVNDGILWFDLPLAALVALVCYPVFKSDQKVSRTEGLGFVLAYIGYLIFLLCWRT